MDRPSYWRHLAEEHGKCAVDFIRAGIEPLLCYEQAVIAGYFGRLHLASQEQKPDLEPYPGPTCEKCHEPLTFANPPFCGACEDAKDKPMTLEGFLSYAASSTVNSR